MWLSENKLNTLQQTNYVHNVKSVTQTSHMHLSTEVYMKPKSKTNVTYLFKYDDQKGLETFITYIMLYAITT